MNAEASVDRSIDIRELSKITGRSLASLRRADATQRLPAGFRLGKSRRWMLSDVLAWLSAGAPERRVWEKTRGQQRRS